MTTEILKNTTPVDLRNWYAGVVLLGYFTNTEAMKNLAEEHGNNFPSVLAERCFIIATAMVLESQKENKP